MVLSKFVCIKNEQNKYSLYDSLCYSHSFFHLFNVFVAKFSDRLLLLKFKVHTYITHCAMLFLQS